jgi:hypothetical protein
MGSGVSSSSLVEQAAAMNKVAAVTTSRESLLWLHVSSMGATKWISSMSLLLSFISSHMSAQLLAGGGVCERVVSIFFSLFGSLCS